MARTTKVTTISLQPQLLERVRDFAGRHHGGKLSTAIAAILEERLPDCHKVEKGDAQALPPQTTTRRFT